MFPDNDAASVMDSSTRMAPPSHIHTALRIPQHHAIIVPANLKSA
jgi:hypothetical protein